MVVNDFEICHCRCHNNPNIMHCMPCCLPCHYCGANIKHFYFEKHVTDCQAAIKNQCTSDSELCDCAFHQLPSRCSPACCKECPKCKLHIKEKFFAEHLEKCSGKKPKK